MFLSIDCLYQVLELTQKKPALLPTVDFFDIWYVQVAYVKNSSTQTHTFIFITNNLNYYYISFYYIVLRFIYYLNICNSYHYILPLPQACPQQWILSCVLTKTYVIQFAGLHIRFNKKSIRTFGERKCAIPW